MKLINQIIKLLLLNFIIYIAVIGSLISDEDMSLDDLATSIHAISFDNNINVMLGGSEGVLEGCRPSQVVFLSENIKLIQKLKCFLYGKQILNVQYFCESIVFGDVAIGFYVDHQNSTVNIVWKRRNLENIDVYPLSNIYGRVMTIKQDENNPFIMVLYKIDGPYSSGLRMYRDS